MRKLLLFTGLFLGCLSAQSKHAGYVYADNNCNGIFDTGDQKLKNVMVSDGLNVVLTDNEGRFSLPGHEKERFVYVTLPSGYTIKKHYISIPGNEYVFALRVYESKVKKDGSHKFIHLADTEIFNTNNHEDWVANVRDYAKNEEAAFIVHTGDICYENGLKNHIRLMNTENMSCQTFYCIGNHDLVKGKYGEELFESLYGPVFYSFDVGNVHYIVTPMLGGDYTPGYSKADVYRWLKNDLALVPPQKRVIVFSHDLLTWDNEFIYGIDKDEYINLNKHNLKAWLYGHWHINHIKKQGNIFSISTAVADKGGIDHSTSAFRVMHIDSHGDFISELRYTYINKLLQITSPANNTSPPTISGKVPLSVNTYHTVSPAKEVIYTCFEGNKLFLKGKLKQKTDWNWYAEIPFSENEDGKLVSVNVNVMFKNGETIESTNTFNYRFNSNPDVKLSDSWTNLLGNPQHVGFVSDTFKLPLRSAWITNIGTNLFMSSPVIAGNYVYVASVDENYTGKAHIHALDGKTGKEVWRYKVRNSVKNSIVTEKGKVFAQDTEGNLYAVDAKTGKLCWETSLPVAKLPAVTEGIVANDGIVYAGTGRGLCAMNADNGELKWTNQDWSQREGASSTLSYGKDCVVSGSQWGGLYVNDAITGKLLWSNEKNGLSDRGSSPAIINGLLYLISRSSLFIIDLETGKTIIRKELAVKVDVTSTPLVTDTHIVFGSQSGLIALSSETLEQKWIFETNEAVVYTGPYTRKGSKTIETSPVLSGKTVFFGASDGYFYAVNVDDGNLLWKHAMGAPVFSTVAGSGNTLIVTDFGGNVYAFVSNPDN